jgi:AmmeMemoRadiSam system protein B
MSLKSHSIRKPVFAGSFYPATKEAILATLQKLESSQATAEKPPNDKPANHATGLIVPHAGWIYSGKTAMAAYQLLKIIQPKKIALLGPGHRVLVHTAVRDSHTAWESPLGITPLIQDRDFEVSNHAHANEHSLEVQLPFIQYFIPDCEILPLVVGQLNEDQIESLAAKLMNKDYFFIFSTDLSHFHPLPEAHRRDLQSIKNIEELHEAGTEACGIHPLRIAFSLMRKLQKKPHLIHYSTSADAFGDTTSVVGYASFWM